jgi:hypothetical protein
MKCTACLEYRVFGTYAFADYPKLLATLRWVTEVWPEWIDHIPHDSMRVDDRKGTVFALPNSQIKMLGTEDRWAAARAAEQYLNQTLTSGWKVFVYFLVPTVWAVCMPPHKRSVEGWWRWPS